jgi:branched-chain amino acid transport system ATP-binding protein
VNSAGPPLLAIAGAGKRFGRLVVVDDLDLAVATGEVVGVVGPNGAGKTTVLNLITGVLRLDRGTVHFAGQNITHHRSAARAKAGIGRTYQIPRPFADLTVFENVLVGASFAAGLRRQASYRAAAAALADVGLLERANTRAGGLPLLDRKRLELARALATSAKLLLLDEIAGGLTEQEVPTIVETVRRLRDRGVTIVWVEHIVHALLSAVDRLVCLANGRVLADGPPEQVLANPDVVSVFLGATFEADAA